MKVNYITLNCSKNHLENKEHFIFNISQKVLNSSASTSCSIPVPHSNLSGCENLKHTLMDLTGNRLLTKITGIHYQIGQDGNDLEKI